PFYVFNDSEARKINLFYKKDVEDYLEKLNGYRGLRKK
ncbi:DNA-binding protein, partial [Listeria monocytogenes]|nr:DNA-binding protein [Listeria monocytogenes]